MMQAHQLHHATTDVKLRQNRFIHYTEDILHEATDPVKHAAVLRAHHVT